MTDQHSAIRLSDIIGLDPKVLDLEREYGIPPFIHIHDQSLTKEVVLTLLALRPIICRQRGDKVYCVGNTRLYQLALRYIDLDQPVPVIMISSRRLDEIYRLFIAERLLLPIVSNHGRGKSKWLFEQWQNLRPALKRLWKKEPLRGSTQILRTHLKRGIVCL